MKRYFSSSIASNSHIGRKILKFNQETLIETTNDTVKVSGKNGQLSLKLNKDLAIEINNNQIKILCNSTQKKSLAMWGTTNKLLQNYIQGVQQGFSLPLKLVGVGYRASMENSQLALKVGKSHPVLFNIPNGVVCTVPAPQFIVLQGTIFKV